MSDFESNELSVKPPVTQVDSVEAIGAEDASFAPSADRELSVKPPVPNAIAEETQE
ncbi:MAG: hypothetical protein WCE75_02450 [Terracidiphilus sp.]